MYTCIRVECRQDRIFLLDPAWKQGSAWKPSLGDGDHGLRADRKQNNRRDARNPEATLRGPKKTDPFGKFFWLDPLGREDRIGRA